MFYKRRYIHVTLLEEETVRISSIWTRSDDTRRMSPWIALVEHTIQGRARQKYADESVSTMGGRNKRKRANVPVGTLHAARSFQ